MNFFRYAGWVLLFSGLLGGAVSAISEHRFATIGAQMAISANFVSGLLLLALDSIRADAAIGRLTQSLESRKLAFELAAGQPGADIDMSPITRAEEQIAVKEREMGERDAMAMLWAAGTVVGVAIVWAIFAHAK